MTTSTLSSPAVSDALTEKPRISSIDLMRGIVMVIMALDHTRDFFHKDALMIDATNLEQTNPLLFFTRIITHYCAPTFVFLSGAAIKLSEQRKSKKDLSIFLLSRGLWLILLEITVIRFSFFFQLYYDVTIFQVIWAIGFCMILLSAVVHLPFRLILALGIVILLGHDALHLIRLQPQDPFYTLWTFTHQVGVAEFAPGKSAFVPYPFLAWFGIMLLGYAFGRWYTSSFTSERRRKLLLVTGSGAVFAFVVLRFINLYGDPAPWSEQKNVLFTFMSFINVTKYPPSLLYTLMTLGPVLILLAFMERWQSPTLKPFIVFGRVPLFYYVLHFYIIHATAIVLYMILQDKSLGEIDLHFDKGFGGITPGAGVSLGVVYVIWISIVVLLYPLCNWYNTYKSKHKNWWLSYL
ncbi:DUF1624 domain-containing protein [Chryseosolibacter indicus]|uniref:DUF1624 domain-containing protein n=1 Tax=Chryseosolibacter indicus TaxID=2782351 RepID=A0ABS5VLR2_9BACT|nr:heparan-alpha-glucosaminide N-acetyltransferase domain-containing protein [Chryseosolibacter indicus]MBT1702387.1 DUF1624 domain-containing protein [Chryseosolibacter indicus]